MPTLPAIFFNLNALKLDWTWHVVEGAAANTNCTKWCSPQQPRLSLDGTSEFLDMISRHPRVKLYRRPWWAGGKVEMVNAPLPSITEQCVLLQCDADEVWTPEQLKRLVELFKEFPQKNLAYFFCRYFVGPDIIITSEGTYGNRSSEWLRAWRFVPGIRFERHEPPMLNGNRGDAFSKTHTRAQGLVFDHYAWTFPNQVAYKEHFYSYKDALSHWTRLQTNKTWPVDLHQFLPWVDAGVIATKV